MSNTTFEIATQHTSDKITIRITQTVPDSWAWTKAIVVVYPELTRTEAHALYRDIKSDLAKQGVRLQRELNL